MNDIPATLWRLARQEQFLEVVERDEAERRFRGHLDLRPLGRETALLSQGLGRVLASAVVAEVDVPGFDRASVDGFAVRADDTLGASERIPCRLTLIPEILTPGRVPLLPVGPATAALIATGGMVAPKSTWRPTAGRRRCAPASSWRTSPPGIWPVSWASSGTRQTSRSALS